MTERQLVTTSSDLATFTAGVLGGARRPVLVVAVDGEVDRANESTLRELVGSATGAVVVDLRRARFVSSSVYGGLLDESARLGRRVGLVVPAEGVARRTLELLDLTGDFDVHTDPDAAVTAVAAQKRGARRSRCDARPSRTSGPPKP